MSDFAPTETDRTFHLVLVLQKFHHAAKFHLVIVLVDVGGKPHFLDVHDLLVAAGFLLLLLLLVPELAVVHDAADRRFGLRRHVDQVKPQILGALQRVPERHDADLLAVRPDYPNFPGANFPVDLMLFANGRPPPNDLNPGPSAEGPPSRGTAQKNAGSRCPHSVYVCRVPRPRSDPSPQEADVAGGRKAKPLHALSRRSPVRCEAGASALSYINIAWFPQSCQHGAVSRRCSCPVPSPHPSAPASTPRPAPRRQANNEARGPRAAGARTGSAGS